MSSAIEIRNLSKKFEISASSSAGTLKEFFGSVLKNPGALLKNRETFWALKDVELDVQRGEILGIIGKNGAGKSTLLKILSGITRPTFGRAKLFGKVSSLLEVGTGFHPELTGRENIFFNGVILGMTKKEITAKFAEIVEFAGVEKFLDMPVKHYSSGMYVRLAFAVAAFLDFDVLLLDEVLSVGDMEFQKKCLSKINEFGRAREKTILFVSHDLGAVSSLCTRTIILEKGKIAASGETDLVIKQYTNTAALTKRLIDSETDFYRLTSMDLKGLNGSESAEIRRGEKIYLDLKVDIRKPDPRLVFGFALVYEGRRIYYSLFSDSTKQFRPKAGQAAFTAEIPTDYLNTGDYELYFISGLHPFEWLEGPDLGKSKVSFRIDGKYQSESPYWVSKRPGLIAPVIKWISKFSA